MSIKPEWWVETDDFLTKSEDELIELQRKIKDDTIININTCRKIGQRITSIKYQRRLFSTDTDQIDFDDERLSVIGPIYAGSAGFTYAYIHDFSEKIEPYLEGKKEIAEDFSNNEYSLSSDTYEFNEILGITKERSKDEKIQGINPITEKILSRSEIYLELLSEIKKYGEDFISLLKNAEDLIKNKSGDWKNLVIFETVELIDRLISLGTPDALIKQQDWFIPDKSAKNGITRKHRVEYFLRARCISSDKETISFIKHLADQISHAQRNNESFKHTKIEQGDLQIINMIDYSRLCLLNIIKYPENFYQKE